MPPEHAMAFVTGLLGGFGHCIGMCGPIAAACSLGDTSRAVSQSAYHIGRVLSYSMTGAVMGLGGSFANTAARMAGFQDAVAVLAGVFMIAIGIGILIGKNPASSLEGKTGPLMRMARAVLASDSAMRFFPLGLLMGFLPCGLSYTAFIAAAGTGDMLRGFFFMLSFGAGTVVPLMMFGRLMAWIALRWRGVVFRLGGLAVIAMGLVFMYRGLAHAAM